MTGPLAFPWEQPVTGPAGALAAGLASAVPSIATTRLRLRAPRLADFAVYAEITTGPRGRHIGGPFTREEAWLDFAQLVAGWTLRGFGLWSVERLADDRLVGFVLLNHEFGDPEPELGFFLRADAEGHGYAFEAAQAARHFAFGILNWSSVVSYIDPENVRSIRLAERMDARRDDHAGTDDLLVYRHHRAAGAQ